MKDNTRLRYSDRSKRDSNRDTIRYKKRQIIPFSLDASAWPRVNINESGTVNETCTVKQKKHYVKLEVMRAQPVPYLKVVAININPSAQILFNFTYMALPFRALSK